MTSELRTAEPRGSAPDASAAAIHDAFISYSRSDRAFAAALEARLERYRPPRDLKAPYRYLEIFRDEQDFTGTEYKSALERHLLASRKLIVICSPAARASAYVAEEIRLFAAAKGAEHIIPILLRGMPNNELAAGGDDSELAFPDALCALMAMPLAASFRGWTGAADPIDRGPYQDAWLTLLANLFDVSRSELEQRERRRQLRTRRRWTSAIATILVTLSALTVWALISRSEAVRQRVEAVRQREEADRQRQIAIARQLASQSELTINQQPNRLTDAVLLAIESLHPAHVAASLEGYQALRHGLSLLPPRPARLPHPGPLIASSLTPDGRFLATLSGGGGKKVVTLWSVSDTVPRPARQLAAPEIVPITAIAVSADARYVALLGPGEVRIWDTQSSGKPIALSPGIRRPTAAAFSPDGRHIAVVGYLGAIFRVWTVEGWKAENRDPSGAFLTLGFTPGGTIVTAGTARLQEWALPDLRPTRECAGAQTTMAALSPDAGSAAVVARDGTVRVIRFGAGNDPSCVETARIRHQEGVTAVAVTSNAGHVAVASQDGTARLWATADTREIARMTHARSVVTLNFDNAATRLFTGGEDDAVLAWTIADGADTRSFAHAADVRAAAFQPDSSTVATLTQDAALQLWGLAPSRGLRVPPQELHAPFVQLDDLRGGFDPVPRVVALGFSAGGRYAAILTTESTLLTWDLVSRTELPETDVDGEDVSRLVIGDDGRVAVLRTDGVVQVVDREQRDSRLRRTLGTGVTGMAFVAPNVRLATIADDAAVGLWDPVTASRLGRLEHGQRITALTSSANGRYLAGQGADNVVIVWDSESGKPVARATIDQGQILSAISPDGSFIAAIRDSVASVWDVRSGSEVARLVHAGAIRGIVFNQDGRLIATSSGDLTARVWRWRPGDLVNEACARLTRHTLPDEWLRLLRTDSTHETCPAKTAPNTPAGAAK